MTDRVLEHALRAVNGEVIAGELHILACQRHLRDLERQRTEEFPYYWDPEAAQNIIDYAETLTIGEGEEPKPVRLIEEQAFDLGCTFGWKKCSNGKRRFRQRYKSVARQNGKSFENGIMGTYIAAFSGYRKGKLFTVATQKKQAKIVWESMKDFIEEDSDLGEYFEIKEYKSEIKCLTTGCTIEALSRESGLNDGFRSIFSSIDEIHQHKDGGIYSAIEKGTRNLPETLVSMITTRGENLNGFCKEMDDYAVSILKGLVTAESFFVDIYCPDEDDDIWDIEAAKKAIPLTYRDPELFSSFKEAMEQAKNQGGDTQRKFIVKDLNRWYENTANGFISSDKLTKCLKDKDLEAFRGKSCTVGIDFSGGGDLTSYALDFDDDEPESVYFYSHSYIPRGRQNEHIKSDVAPYDVWEKDGLITVTGGEMSFKNDYKFIIKELRELRERYELEFLGIGIDQYNADGVLSDLEEFGCPVIVIYQTPKYLSRPTEDIQLSAKSEKVSWDRKNELLTWSFNNAETVTNSYGEIKLDKADGKRNRRIDPADACVDAHFVKIKLREEDKPVDLNESMQRYLEIMGWN